MYKLSAVCTVLLSLVGCTGGPTQPQAFLDGALRSDAPQGAPIPIKTFDVSEFDYEMVCEDLRRPGSRIIVERRCYKADRSPANDSLQQELTRLHIEALRRDQARLEQWQRAAETARQREVLRRTLTRRE